MRNGGRWPPRTLRRTHRVIVVASVGLAIALPLGLGSWYLGRHLEGMGLQAPDAAVTAAVEQYGQRKGLAHLEVSGVAGWDDCAVVGLADPVTGTYYGSVLVAKEQGRWLLRGSPETGLPVDPDDLVGYHGRCLELARAAVGQG